METKAKVKWEQKRREERRYGESGAEGGALCRDSALAAGGSLLGCN